MDINSSMLPDGSDIFNPLYAQSEFEHILFSPQDLVDHIEAYFPPDELFTLFGEGYREVLSLGIHALAIPQPYPVPVSEFAFMMMLKDMDNGSDQLFDARTYQIFMWFAVSIGLVYDMTREGAPFRSFATNDFLFRR